MTVGSGGAPSKITISVWLAWNVALLISDGKYRSLRGANIAPCQTG